jgi:hypothetical protein
MPCQYVVNIRFTFLRQPELQKGIADPWYVTDQTDFLYQGE